MRVSGFYRTRQRYRCRLALGVADSGRPPSFHGRETMALRLARQSKEDQRRSREPRLYRLGRSLALPELALPELALPCLALPCLAVACLALACLALLTQILITQVSD